jgi:hypothetical protein
MAVTTESGKRFCPKCCKTLKETEFYTRKNGEKSNMCKKCETMHLDAWDPETFTWLCETYDVPYIPSAWNNIRDKDFAKNPKKFNSTAVFGKYLSKMKLKQWKNYTWADTEELMKAEEAAAQAQKEDFKKQQEQVEKSFKEGTITEAEYQTYQDAVKQKEEFEERQIEEAQKAACKARQTIQEQIDENNRKHIPNYFEELPSSHFSAIDANNMLAGPFSEVSKIELPDLTKDLTDEDKKMLLLKWGRDYSMNEWIDLEKKYNEMTESFDIRDSDSKSALILICKTELKLNQALDSGDYEGYQKLSRVYNDLRKSSKFTAAQKKEEEKENFDSIGALVRWCEKEGGAIPRYEIKAPYDIIDTIITDLKDYNYHLFADDPTMADAMENYLMKKKVQEEEKKDRQEEKKTGVKKTLTDDDFVVEKERRTEEAEEDAQRVGI